MITLLFYLSQQFKKTLLHLKIKDGIWTYSDGLDKITKYNNLQVFTTIFLISIPDNNN